MGCGASTLQQHVPVAGNTLAPPSPLSVALDATPAGGNDAAADTISTPPRSPSDGSITDEPGETRMKFRVLRHVFAARVFHGIDGDVPCEASAAAKTAPKVDEVLSSKATVAKWLDSNDGESEQHSDNSKRLVVEDATHLGVHDEQHSRAPQRRRSSLRLSRVLLEAHERSTWRRQSHSESECVDSTFTS